MNQISTISILLACYVMTLMPIVVINRKKPGIASYQNPRASDLGILCTIHFLGVFFMLLPMWLIDSPPFFLLLFPEKGSYAQVLVLLFSLFAIILLPWKKWNKQIANPVNQSMSVVQILLYFSSRIVYLIVYEWFFRGLLLISFFHLLGVAWAVIINILLYVLAHFHKDRKEIISCIPFGLLLCLFTIWLQSIWPAIVIHLLIAIINEWPPVSRFLSQQKEAVL